jgi:micrococcal nuclease
LKKKLSLILFIFLSSAFADEVIHDFRIIEVIDGDTVKIEANYLPAPLPKELKLRIIGIDTPEKGNRAKCDLERAMAKEATEFLKKFISSENILGISLTKWDKFGGRVLGDIITQDNQRVSQIIIDRDYGRPYHGKKKISWCE